jgi:hypothetical protein
VAILIQFILRLSFGMAAAMTLVPPRDVTSGYYRNNLYVLLGLNSLAALALGTAEHSLAAASSAIAAAILSYFGAVAWLYERPTLGLGFLGAIAVTDLAAAWGATSATSASSATWLLAGLDPASGGLVLGTTMAAMLLGHWYLNAPGMPLAPLVRLIGLLGVAVILRVIVCGAGLGLEIDAAGRPDVTETIFLGMRWIGGLVGTAILAVMAWQTLKIPNTQSATGILYVAVITTFLGELASGLLSAQATYPL